MRKKYWINRGRFVNEYALFYTTSLDEEKKLKSLYPDVERITYQGMLTKIRCEKDRRKTNKLFSGYGDIAPHKIK